MARLKNFLEWKLILESYSFEFDPTGNYPDKDFGLPTGRVDSGKAGYGGDNNDWGGSMQRTLAFAKIANEFMGKDVILSQKRSRVKTAKGTVSDHYDGQKDAYAVDLSCRGTEGDRLLAHLMQWFGHPECKGGKWFNVKKGGYRYQFGWKLKDHFDHIHIGVRKTGSRDSRPSEPDIPSPDNEYKRGDLEPGVYREERGDPYEYKVVDGIWWTIGPRIPEWTSLEQNKEANEILDARYPEARTTKEKMLNAMHYKKEPIPTKFEPSKMRAGIIGAATSKISGWKEKIFTPSTGEHSTITIPNNQKKGPVPVIVLYPGIKVGNQIGKEYMPPLIRQAVPDWYDKYVIVIPDEHSTRWSDVKKDITEALSRSGLSQKSLTLGLFSGSGGRGTDVSRNLQSISPNNLLLMDPSPGKNLIDAIAYLPKETQVIMEYNPKNWGSPKWYTDYIGKLVDEVQKRGLVYDTQGLNKDHMNIPSDMLIRYKQNIESNL